MRLTERDVTAYKCPSCGQIEASDDLDCCGESPETIAATAQIKPPDKEQIAHDIFGIKPTGLAICHVLMAEGEATTDELTDFIDADRSTISRHLNHLDELGFVTKRSESVATGARVHVYSSRSPDEIRQKLALGLTLRREKAIELADELTDEKIEMIQEGANELIGMTDEEATTQDAEGAVTSDGESSTGGGRPSLFNRLFGDEP